MKKSTYTYSSLITAVTAALLICGAGCSKDEGSASSVASGKSAVSSGLLDSLPEHTAAVATFLPDSPAYKQFKESGWGASTSSSITTALATLKAQPSTATFVPYAEALLNSGIISFDPKKPDALSSALFVLAKIEGGDLFAWQATLNAKSSEDLTNSLKILQDTLSKGGVAVEPRTLSDGTKGFALATSAAANATSSDGAPAGGKLYIFASPKRLVAAASEERAQSALTGAPTQEWTRIKATPQFQKVESTLETPNQISFGYVDITDIIQHSSSAMSQTLTTQGVSGIDEAKIKNIPFQSAAFTRSIDDGSVQHDKFSFALEPKDKDQTKLINALSITSGSTIADSFSSESAIFLGINGEAVSKLKAVIVESLPPEQVQALPPQLAYLDTLGGIGLALMNASSTSPFPELVLAIKSPKAEELKGQLKDGIGLALRSQGAGSMGSWMEREIAGAKVSYIVTPFGIGAYIATKGDILVLTSSEGSITQYLSGKAPSLKERFAAHTKSTTTPAVISAYADFSRVSALIESLQGSLAMFTGGKSFVEPQVTAELRQVGKVTFTLSGYDGKKISADTSYEQPAAAPAK